MGSGAKFNIMMGAFLLLAAGAFEGCSLKFRSDAANRLLAGISVASINTPPILLKGGATQSVTFTLPVDFQSGTLEYAADGLTYGALTSLSSGQSSYSWSVPAADTTTARLRLNLTTLTGTSVVASGFFEIDATAPLISLNNLVGGEVLPAGASFAINWTATDANFNTSAISIEVSSNSGVSYSAISGATGISNTSTYSWTTPSVNSSTYRVRIKAIDAVGNASAWVASASDFSISNVGATVLVTYPNGGEYIPGGPPNTTVTWSYSGLAPGPSTATIEYSINSGSSWNPIGGATGITNTGSYVWTAPSVEASTYRIRVTLTDSATSVYSDSSNADFTIDATDPSLTINTPLQAGGSYLQGSSPYNITWTTSDNNPFGATPIKIEVSSDGGATFPTTLTSGVAATPSTYAWSVPGVQGSTYQLKLTATDRAGRTFSRTTGNFYVDTTDPAVNVSAPAAAVYLSGGSTWNVAWTATDTNYGLQAVNPIQIEFYNASTASWSSLVASGPNTSPYTGSTVPNLDITGNKIRVTATDRSGRAGVYTTGGFTIDSTNPLVSLTTPDASGIVLKGGQSYNISWTASDTNLGATPIKLEYSLNNGGTWTTIAAATANTSPYAWTVPASTNTQQGRVRVTATDLAGRTASDSSSNAFTIDSTLPSVSLISPVGVEYLLGGGSTNIQWNLATDATYALATNPIQIEYHNGATWATIAGASALSNSGTFAWTVPAVDSASYKVRISATDAAGNVSAFDGTNTSTSFTIDNTTPTLTLTSLTGGQTIMGGTATAITWTSADTNFGATPIAISLSTDGGATFPTVLTAGVANSGSYTWTPPTNATVTTYRVRIVATDRVGHTITRSSTSNFTVQKPPFYTSGTQPMTAATEVWVVTGDINADGKMDVAASGISNSEVCTFLGNGDGTLQTKVCKAAVTRGVALGDIDGDGDLDLASVNGCTNFSYWLNNGAGTYGSITNIPIGVCATRYGVSLTDFNNDSKLDAVVSDYNNNTLNIGMGNGSGGFSFTSMVAEGLTGGSTCSVISNTVFDINADGFMDILAGCFNESIFGTWLGIGTGTNTGFSRPSPAAVATGNAPISVSIGDFNEDGKQDIAVSTQGINRVQVYKGNNDGTFNSTVLANLTTATGPVMSGAALFNADAHLDLVVVTQTSLHYWPGNGNGTFGTRMDIPLAGVSYQLKVADMNGDGKPDVIIGENTPGQVKVMLNNF